MANSSGPPKPRFEIQSWLQPQAGVPRTLPTVLYVIGPQGRADTGYGTTEPVQLTKQNIADHGGVVTVLENLKVVYPLPWNPAETFELIVPRLELRGHTRTWPKQISEQVPLVARAELAKRVFRETQGNLRLRDKVTRYLAAAARPADQS